MDSKELMRNIKLQELGIDAEYDEAMAKLVKALQFEDFNTYRPWKHSNGYYNIEYSGRDLKNLAFKYDCFDETLHIHNYSDIYIKLKHDYRIDKETICMILKMYFEKKYDCVVKKATVNYSSFKSGELYCLNQVEEEPAGYDINKKDEDDDTEFA